MIKVKRESIEKEVVEPYFEQWNELSSHIHKAHDLRNGEAKSLMDKGILLFENCIVNCSETTSQSINESEEYEVLPINGMERLQFIKTRPGQYACFRQLDELFKELKKRLARLRISA
ncbi:YpoC family protein [Ureibacillus sp. GCM10028918]|uniref:YpoC family protein n=1 Tax=Ureibacillus sp. GCM10028918 TaxID=3273429 RepID=UPI0036177E61